MQRLLAASPERECPDLTAKVLHGAGVMAHTLCDYAAADGFHQEALAMRRMLRDPEGVADSLHCLSSSAMAQGHYARAETLATECLTMRRRLSNRAAWRAR